MPWLRRWANDVVVRFGADTAGLNAGVAAAASQIKGFTALVGLAGVVAVSAFAGVSVAATKMAGDFQFSINKLYTTAGELQTNLSMISSGILKLSTDVGYGAQTMADAMYFVESAGFHGADALNVMRIAAEGAKTENADLTGVVQALASAMNAYRIPASGAATVMNTLVAATANGMMSLDNLTAGLKNVAPAAAQFGISLVDVGAAMAVMTTQGDNATSAGTHLRQVILAIEKPARAGADALHSVGLTTQQVADAMKVSLPGALQMITDAIGTKFPAGSAAYNAALANISGGNRQFMGMLETTGSHMNTFVSDVMKMTEQIKAGGNAVMGWTELQTTFRFQMDRAKVVVEAVAISFGTMLLPVATVLMGRFIGLAQSVGQFVNSLDPKAVQTFIAGGLDNLGKAFNTVKGYVESLGVILDSTFAALGIMFGQVLPQLATSVGTVLGTFFVVLRDVIAAIAPVLPPLVDAFGQLAVAFLKAATTGIQVILVSVSDVLKVILPPAIQVATAILNIATALLKIPVVGVVIATLATGFLALSIAMNAARAAAVGFSIVTLIQGIPSAIESLQILSLIIWDNVAAWIALRATQIGAIFAPVLAFIAPLTASMTLLTAATLGDVGAWIALRAVQVVGWLNAIEGPTVALIPLMGSLAVAAWTNVSAWVALRATQVVGWINSIEGPTVALIPLMGSLAASVWANVSAWVALKAVQIGAIFANLPAAISSLTTSMLSFAAAIPIATAALVVLDAALVANMIAQQQADDATMAANQSSSAAIKKYTSDEIASLQQLKSQGLLKSAADWDNYKQSITATVQSLTGASYDEAQKMAQNIIDAAKKATTGVKNAFYGLPPAMKASLDQTTSEYQQWLDSDGGVSWAQFQQNIKDQATKVQSTWSQSVERVYNGPSLNGGNLVSISEQVDSIANKLKGLSGTSVWNAYVYTNYISTGAPGSSIGNINARAAGGMITEPVVGVGVRTGQRWSFGEAGNEMVVPMTGGKSGLSSGKVSSTGDIHVHVEIGGKEVMHTILNEVDKAVRAKYGNRSRIT